MFYLLTKKQSLQKLLTSFLGFRLWLSADSHKTTNNCISFFFFFNLQLFYVQNAVFPWITLCLCRRKLRRIPGKMALSSVMLCESLSNREGTFWPWTVPKIDVRKATWREIFPLIQEVDVFQILPFILSIPLVILLEFSVLNRQLAKNSPSHDLGGRLC